MEHLYKEKTPHTPEVYFNLDESKLCLIGRSFPEDATSFYAPILTWLENNIDYFEKEFTLEIQLEYYNTSSSKYILKMFSFLEKYLQNHTTKICVRWKYKEEDDDMKNAGLEYQQFVSVPFEFAIAE